MLRTFIFSINKRILETWPENDDGSYDYWYVFDRYKKDNLPVKEMVLFVENEAALSFVVADKIGNQNAGNGNYWPITKEQIAQILFIAEFDLFSDTFSRQQSKWLNDLKTNLHKVNFETETLLFITKKV